MRDPEKFLEVLADRGRKRLPLERVYRNLFNPEWFLRAYGKIYRNRGAMTPGVTDETADGMSLEKIQAIISLLRQERYRWKPVRRTHLPKKKGGLRPLGIPSWSDKLVQEVVRTFLEAYYEPQFSDNSHGFRPGRSCHTALLKIKRSWTGVIWFIEGDISKCFDKIDISILLELLSESIHDGRFIRLIKGLLKAGHMENWQWNATMSGTPQGGIVSPILSNVYLHELDRYVEETLIPEHTQGRWRRLNPDYTRTLRRKTRARKCGDAELTRQLAKQLRTIPSKDTSDPGYRRLRYVRYADDILLGFIGPRKEAEEIQEQLRKFLANKLHLELSPDKTLLTHAKSGKARFLGYDITVSIGNTKLRMVRGRKKRVVNGDIALLMPSDVFKRVREMYTKAGKILERSDFRCDNDYTIINRYQAVLRGIYNYYQLAVDVSGQMRPIRWCLERSLVATLARKYRCTAKKILRRYQTTHDGLRALECRIERGEKEPLIARFGGISFQRVTEPLEVQDYSPFKVWHYYSTRRVELITRLMKGECELCGSTENIEVHHISKLSNLKHLPKLSWVRIMAARKRKTLVVCRACHRKIHSGKYNERSLNSSSESRMN